MRVLAALLIAASLMGRPAVAAAPVPIPVPTTDPYPDPFRLACRGPAQQMNACLAVTYVRVYDRLRDGVHTARVAFTGARRGSFERMLSTWWRATMLTCEWVNGQFQTGAVQGFEDVLCRVRLAQEFTARLHTAVNGPAAIVLSDAGTHQLVDLAGFFRGYAAVHAPGEQAIILRRSEQWWEVYAEDFAILSGSNIRGALANERIRDLKSFLIPAR